MERPPEITINKLQENRDKQLADQNQKNAALEKKETDENLKLEKEKQKYVENYKANKRLEKQQQDAYEKANGYTGEKARNFAERYNVAFGFYTSLDPVAAGGIPWRDGIIREFVEKQPTVIRGNASEILALAGEKSGGKGVDSTDSSDAAVEGAMRLAGSSGSIVVVTGETDYVTDGVRTLRVTGGDPMATLVVGTGCSLSALVAAFCAVSDDRLTASATACALAKKAAEAARRRSEGPGSFHNAYLDGLHLIKPADFTSAE